MKRAILGMIVALLATSAMAQPAAPASEETKKVSWRERCDALSGLAGSIMEAHQTGVSMSAAMRAADSDPLTEKMIIAAYEKPRYSTDKMKRQEIAEFRDTVYLMCSRHAKK